MSVSAEDAEVTVTVMNTRPAVPPPGAVFSLGWVMAQLFDARRRASVTVRQPPFDADVQLPQVPDLEPDPKLVFLAADLRELLHWFPALRRTSKAVTAQTELLKPAILQQAEAVAEDAGKGEPAGAEPAAAEQPGVAPQFDPEALKTAVILLHEAILDQFADNPERLSAYQLGLALSDLTWLPYIAAAGDNATAGKPSALMAGFARSQTAPLKTLLSGAGSQLPPSAASIVSKSLDNWADWLDVNVAKFKAAGGDTWAPTAGLVLQALRVQGWVWRSVLIADPQVSVQPSMGAWVHAASAMLRATRMITAEVLRKFWPLVLIMLAGLGGAFYMVISFAAGFSKVNGAQLWATLVTAAAVFGGGGAGLLSGVGRAFGGVSYEILEASKLDASAWNVTWLPAMTSTASARTKLANRGVANPQLRKNLDLGKPR